MDASAELTAPAIRATASEMEVPSPSGDEHLIYISIVFLFTKKALIAFSNKFVCLL